MSHDCCTSPDPSLDPSPGSSPDPSPTASGTPGPPHPGYDQDKAKYLNRLKRIEGQARGITRMVDEGQYCIDVLTQISAMTRALQAVATGLLDDHIAHCVLDAARSGDEEEIALKLREASAAIGRLVRS